MTNRRLTEQGEIRFYEWIENKVKEEGSGRAFCDRTGLFESDLAKYRKGSKAPTTYIAEKLAKAYDMTAEDIIGKDGAMTGDMKPRGNRTGTKRKPKEKQAAEKPKTEPDKEDSESAAVPIEKRFCWVIPEGYSKPLLRVNMTGNQLSESVLVNLDHDHQKRQCKRVSDEFRLYENSLTNMKNHYGIVKVFEVIGEWTYSERIF